LRHGLRGSRRNACRVANGAGATAILSEVTDQTIHRVEIGAVPDESALRTRGNEPRVGQFLQVEGERRRWQAEALGNGTSRQALRGVLDQQPKYREAVFLRQRAKGDQSSRRFHDSNNIKSTEPCQSHPGGASFRFDRNVPEFVAASTDRCRPESRGLGPMQVRTYRPEGKPYDVDIPQLPGGEQYAEISRKVPAADTARTMRAIKADLTRAGVEMRLINRRKP
jgi:hypothetical protein